MHVRHNHSLVLLNAVSSQVGIGPVDGVRPHAGVGKRIGRGAGDRPVTIVRRCGRRNARRTFGSNSRQGRQIRNRRRRICAGDSDRLILGTGVSAGVGIGPVNNERARILIGARVLGRTGDLATAVVRRGRGFDDHYEARSG